MRASLRSLGPAQAGKGEAVESPSLEIFQTHLDTVLCSLLWVTLLGQGVGLGDPQRSLPTPTMLGFYEQPCPQTRRFEGAQLPTSPNSFPRPGAVTAPNVCLDPAGRRQAQAPGKAVCPQTPQNGPKTSAPTALPSAAQPTSCHLLPSPATMPGQLGEGTAAGKARRWEKALNPTAAA